MVMDDINIVIKDNKTCKIESINVDIINEISDLLSYKQTGSEYTQAYKLGAWDGRVRLLTNKNEFKIGLLTKVKQYLDLNKINYNLLDNRKNNKTYNKYNLKNIGLVPRDYQIRCVDAAKENEIGIIRASVGAGKTYVAALLAAEFNKPTIIYVIGLDLLQQFHDLFSKLFDEEIGWIGNGICKPKRITIASVWTLGSALKMKKNIMSDEDEYIKELPPSTQDKIKIQKCMKEAAIHIIDECHSCTCETLQQIYKLINPERLYGLSGTPFRDDGSDLLTEAMLGQIIVNVSCSELIERKILAQPVIKFVNTPKYSTSLKTYQEIYKEFIVNNEIRNALIVKNTKTLIEKKYKPLVLFKTIEHGQNLYKLFLENNIRCELLYGNDSLEKRNEIKDKLNNDEIDCIIASTIFDIGLDLPKLSALVLAGSGKSRVRIIQRIGRVIRGFQGKARAAIVDFMDNVKMLDKHSIIRYETYLSEPGFKILGK